MTQSLAYNNVAKLRGIVDITEPRFGAVVDGVTDDYDACRAAVLYLNSLGGGRLHFPAGTTIVTRPIPFRSNIEYVGDGWNSIVKMAPSTAAAIFTATFAGTTMTVTAVAQGRIGFGTLIRGAGLSLETQVTALGTGTGGAGTYTTNSSNTLGPITCYEVAQTVFGAADGNNPATGVLVRDLTVDGNSANNLYPPDDTFGHGVDFSYCFRSTVTRCQIQNTYSNGVVVNQGAYNDIVGNYIHDIGNVTMPLYYSWNGVVLATNGQHNKVRYNFIADCLQAGVHENSNGLTGGQSERGAEIIGNYIYSCTGDGIYVGDAAATIIHYPTIADNFCYQNGGHGIVVSKSDVSGFVHDPIVRNNHCVANTGYGIKIGDTAGGVINAIINGNDVRANVDRGLAIAGVQPTITNNQIMGNGQDGIFIGSCTDGIISHNVVLTNAGSGGSNFNNFAGTRMLIAENVTDTSKGIIAGEIGEFLEATLASGSATSLTNGAAKTITSVSLTAGQWDVDGMAGFVPAAGTTFGYIQYGASQTNNTMPAEANLAQQSYVTGTVFSGNILQFPIPMQKFTLTATTTVYLVALAGFGTDTLTAYGHIRARRVR